VEEINGIRLLIFLVEYLFTVHFFKKYYIAFMELKLPEYHFCPRCSAPVELLFTQGRTRPVCNSCGYIIYVNPIPAATCVLLDAGNVLLALRGVEPHRGEWCLPGGFIELGESPEEAARRELLEETGINAEKFSLTGVYSSFPETRIHVLLVAFRVLEWTGKPTAGDDASDVQWFDVNNVPPLAFAIHKKALADSLREVNKS